MVKLILALCAAAGLSGCGSGTSPVTYCDNFQTALCARQFQCTDAATQATPDFQANWGTSPTDCAAKAKAQNCATVTNDHPCVINGTTYHPDKADACVADIKSEPCSSLLNQMTPESCGAVCS